MHQRSQSSRSLRFGLDKGRLVVAEENPFIQHDAAASTRFHAINDVLQEEHLGGAGLVGKPGLRLFALLAAEWRVHEDHVIEGRGFSQRGRRKFPEPVRVLPCQIWGSSMWWRTRFARAIG